MERWSARLDFKGRYKLLSKLQGIVYINACLNILKEIGCDYKIALALETKEWFPKAYFDLEKELGNNTTLQQIGNRIGNHYKFIDEDGKIEEDGHWIIPFGKLI